MASPPIYTAQVATTPLAESATAISLLTLAPGAPAMRIRGLDISLDAEVAGKAVRFDLYRSTGSAPTGTALTPTPINEADPAAATVAKKVITVEPGTKIIIASYYVQPLGGFIPVVFPYGAEPATKGAGQVLGIQYTTAAAVKPDCLINLWFEE